MESAKKSRCHTLNKLTTNYAHLNWGSINSVDVGVTCRPVIVGS